MRKVIRCTVWLLTCSVAGFAQDSTTYLDGCRWMLELNSEKHAWQHKWKKSLSKPDSLCDADELFYLGSIFKAKGQLGQAVTYYEKTAQKDPTMQGMVGFELLTGFRDSDAALRYFERFDARTPNFDDISANDPISFRKGLAYAMLGNHAEAVRQFDKAIGGIEGKHGAEWVNYKFYVTRAVSLLALNQPETALTDLAKALKNYDRSAIARFYQGQAYQQLCRLLEAKEAFQDALLRLQVIRYQHEDYNEGLIYNLYEGQIDDALKALKP